MLEPKRTSGGQLPKPYFICLHMTRELIGLIGAEAGRRAARLAGDRWVVATSAQGISFLEAYGYIRSQLRMATAFKKILIVLGDGRVEASNAG